MSSVKKEFPRLVPRTGITVNVYNMLCVEGVGVVKDEKLRIEEIEDYHTLGGSGICYIIFFYFESRK
jgi:hypothetical protein